MLGSGFTFWMNEVALAVSSRAKRCIFFGKSGGLTIRNRCLNCRFKLYLHHVRQLPVLRILRSSPRRKRRAICVRLLGLAAAVAPVALMLHDYVRADVLGGPLPSPRLPPDTIQLTPVEKLGKLMLYDSTLSNPPGYSCATCHVHETALRDPIPKLTRSRAHSPGSCLAGSAIASPRVISTPRSVPEGPYYDPHLQVWLGGNFWDGRVPDVAKQGLQPPINPNEMANDP